MVYEEQELLYLHIMVSTDNIVKFVPATVASNNFDANLILQYLLSKLLLGQNLGKEYNHA